MPGYEDGVTITSVSQFKLYLARLDHGETPPGTIPMGVFREGKLVARSAIEEEHLISLSHALESGPVRLVYACRFESPGIAGRLYALVPVERVPDELIPKEEGEEWKEVERPPDGIAVLVSLGTLVRYEADRQFGPDLLAEGLSILTNALDGHAVDPVDKLLKSL